jgi:4-phosphopantoate--beta-alanine ligase
VALAAKEIGELAAAIPARVEVNLFHRTPERVAGLVDLMDAAGVTALGAEPDFHIPGLSSERGKCCRAGIGRADVVLVPLEDGDRCQALVEMGKRVITIDLNPLSRTARTAHITIVDELIRVLPQLVVAVGAARGGATATRKEEGTTKARRDSWKSGARTEHTTTVFNNTENLKATMKEMVRNIAT